MSGMLTMSGWQTLINGNLDWLSTLDRTLEREHVIDCMRLLRDVRPSVIDLRADGINNLKEENAALRAQVERLEAAKLRLREVVKSVEFGGYLCQCDDVVEACPACVCARGHHPQCQLAAVLREKDVDNETGRE